MKLIDGIIKELILDEGEVLLISALHKNRRKLKITLNNGALEIDDVPMKKIEQIKEEEESISAMRAYQEKKAKK